MRVIMVIASQAEQMMTNWPRYAVDVDSDGEWFMLTRHEGSDSCGCKSTVEKRIQGRVVVNMRALSPDNIKLLVTYSECSNLWEGEYTLAHFMDTAANHDWLHKDCRRFAVWDCWSRQFGIDSLDELPESALDTDS